LFGSKEEHSLKPVIQYLKILEKRAHSRSFESHLVKGAMHNFYGHESEVANLIYRFVSKLQNNHSV
jgi:hypothetical protein